MPIVNTFETDKFHTLTNRLLTKQKFNKQTSAEVGNLKHWQYIEF